MLKFQIDIQACFTTFTCSNRFSSLSYRWKECHTGTVLLKRDNYCSFAFSLLSTSLVRAWARQNKKMACTHSLDLNQYFQPRKLSKRTERRLIKLSGCTGSSVFARRTAILLVLSCCGSNQTILASLFAVISLPDRPVPLSFMLQQPLYTYIRTHARSHTNRFMQQTSTTTPYSVTDILKAKKKKKKKKQRKKSSSCITFFFCVL